MLIIVIHGLLDIFKMLRSQHPGITDGVILIENMLGKTVGIIQDDMPPVNLHHKTAAVQDQGSVFFLIQDPRL